MQRQSERIRKRIAKLTDVLRSKIYVDSRPLDQLLVSTVATERISYAEAQKLDYRPAKLGELFGPLWATFWFRGQAAIPKEWAHRRVDLIWVAHYCESTLWIDGKVAQALNYSFGERYEAPIAESAKANEKIEFQIEMACNSAYGQWPPEKPYHMLSPYVLDRCEIAAFDPLAWKIYIDFLVLQQLEAELATADDTKEQAFGAELLHKLNRFANEYDADDRKTWQAAHNILTDLLKHRNDTRVHELTAIGEGHLDLAWWWPFAETRRKIIRTASNQVALMDAYPEYKFTCTQACFYDELKQLMPELYRRVKAKIANGQWIPVGGMWVEADCNLPTGEALVRQFLYGQRFFQKEFGFMAGECWLQDSFGFNAQLPQIMKLAGIDRFVTQKFYWSHLKPEHHLFSWHGLDGSQVLAHFPSGVTFSRPLNIASINKAVKEYTDDSCSARSILSFGWGDGGGGPTREMIEVISRLKDLHGAPQVVMRSPSEFFQLVEADLAKRPPTTTAGELYFARHRGTYTSQAATKKAMRKAERLLHDTEFLCAVAFKLGSSAYPQDEINRLWKIVLLNQHHDIVTGTSIAMVHEEAVRQLEEVAASCRQLSEKALQALGGAEMVNTIGFARQEIAETPDGKVVIIDAPAYGMGKIVNSDLSSHTMTANDKNGIITLENENLLAEFNHGGDLLKLFDKTTNREALSGPGNRLQIYDDHTVDYDAWEIEPFHLETVKDCPAAHSYKIVPASAPAAKGEGTAPSRSLRAEIVFERKIGSHSVMKQIARLDAMSRRLEFHCEVDWHESHKLLKVLFPASVEARHATYETQFGATERPTHYDTPADEARFEVFGHKWADLSDHDFGVALLSDSKYGFSVYGNEMRVSLLRAPKSPDPLADMGRHEFAYAVMPHRGRWQAAQVVAEGFKFSYPIVWAIDSLQSRGGASPSAGEQCSIAGRDEPCSPAGPHQSTNGELHSFAHVDDPNLVLDTIKKAEDSDALIVRLYECHGARGTANLQLGFPVKSAKFTNILEDSIADAKLADDTVQIPYSPFQIITLSLL